MTSMRKTRSCVTSELVLQLHLGSERSADSQITCGLWGQNVNQHVTRNGYDKVTARSRRLERDSFGHVSSSRTHPAFICIPPRTGHHKNNPLVYGRHEAQHYLGVLVMLCGGGDVVGSKQGGKV